MGLKPDQGMIGRRLQAGSWVQECAPAVAETTLLCGAVDQ
jgi:hypothetical protein